MPAVNVNTVSPELELPVPFAPTQRKLTSEDYLRVFQYTPFNDLPKQLIPLRIHSMRAPLMHCGWTMDRLWKYAEDNGFVHSTATETFTEDELASAEFPPISESFVIDEGQCMSNALEDIGAKHGIKDILEFTEIERVVRDGKGGFISLYTNYTRKRAPPAEFVEKLRVALGQNGTWIHFGVTGNRSLNYYSAGNQSRRLHPPAASLQNLALIDWQRH